MLDSTHWFFGQNLLQQREGKFEQFKPSKQNLSTGVCI
jgi:hypothetical protein